MLKGVGISTIDNETIDKLNDSRNFKMNINKIQNIAKYSSKKFKHYTIPFSILKGHILLLKKDCIAESSMQPSGLPEVPHTFLWLPSHTGNM